MSAETKAALEDALAAHLADERDGMVIGYVLYAAYTNAELDTDDVNGYYFLRPAGQPYHSSLGLMYSMLEDFTMPTHGSDDD